MTHNRSANQSYRVKVWEVHGKQKGVNQFWKPGKLALKQTNKPSLAHVPIQRKIQPQVKHRTGQGRAGIRRKILCKFPMPQSHYKHRTT